MFQSPKTLGGCICLLVGIAIGDHSKLFDNNQEQNGREKDSGDEEVYNNPTDIGGLYNISSLYSPFKKKMIIIAILLVYLQIGVKMSTDPCTYSTTYQYTDYSSVKNLRLRLSKDGGYIYGTTVGSSSYDKYVLYVPYCDAGNIPLFRLNSNDGTVSLTKSFSGCSQSLSSAAFSNSLPYWASGNYLAIVKLLSSDFSIVDSYQYTITGYGGYKTFLDKLSILDSSDELLFTVGPDGSSSPNFLLIKHDFGSTNHLVSVHEINPGATTGNRFSRFKRYFDYTNSIGYLTCAEQGNLLFFSIDTNTISLLKGFYINSPIDSTSAAADITLNISNGLVYISSLQSSKTLIFAYNPSTNSFGDTLQTNTNILHKFRIDPIEIL